MKFSKFPIFLQNLVRKSKEPFCGGSLRESLGVIGKKENTITYKLINYEKLKMENNNQSKDIQKCFVVAVALKKKRFNHFVSEPKTFYDTMEQAEKIKNEQIKKGRFKEEQLKIITVWKVKL